jgi:hypothetical protein
VRPCFARGLRRAARRERLTRKEALALAQAIKDVLGEAIKIGGTTLRDYVNAEGTPGYFSQKLFVYERAGETCRVCKSPSSNSSRGSGPRTGVRPANTEMRPSIALAQGPNVHRTVPCVQYTIPSPSPRGSDAASTLPVAIVPGNDLHVAPLPARQFQPVAHGLQLFDFLVGEAPCS